MNPTLYQDPAQLINKLHNDLWDALVDTLSVPQVALIQCLAPDCVPNPEIAQRKLLALNTITQILYVRTTIGNEGITAVLTELAYCNC